MTEEFFDPVVMMALASDTRLSADARTLALHVYGRGPGAHEISYSELRRLLNQAGERRVRTAVQDAADVGWITVVHGGARESRFTFHPDPDEAAHGAVSNHRRRRNEDEAAHGAVSNPDSETALCAASSETATNEAAHGAASTELETALCAASSEPSHVRDQGDQKTSSPSSSSPSAGAQAGGTSLADPGATSPPTSVPTSLFDDPGLGRLRDALGPFASAVDAMAAVQLQHAPGRPMGWAWYIAAAYLGQSPTDPLAIAGVPPPDRPQRVALAMQRFTADGQKYDNRLFRAYLTKAVEHSSGNADGDAATAGRSKPRSTPAALAIGAHRPKNEYAEFA